MLSAKPVRPEPRPEVMAIDAYVPGKSAVDGLKFAGSVVGAA